MPKRSQANSYRELIVEHIKDYIVTNQLKGGDPLPTEGQIVEDLGISRTPVREAVKSLESLGIIEARQGEGIFVREWNFSGIVETLNYGARINPKTIYELYQIRVWLEISVIGEVIKKITDFKIAKLDFTLFEWEQAIQNNQPYIMYDQKFHNMIFSVMENETLVMLFEVFWAAFENFGEENDRMASDTNRVIKEHRDVLEAIKQRDPDLARKTLHIQFLGFLKRLERNYGRADGGIKSKINYS